MIITLGPDTDCDTREQLLRGLLSQGWCVAVNNVDYEVQQVTNDGLEVKHWHPSLGKGVGAPFMIEWPKVETMTIY